MVIHVVVGETGTFLKGQEKRTFGKLVIKEKMKTTHKTHLRSARILRRIRENWRDSFSQRFLWKSIVKTVVKIWKRYTTSTTTINTGRCQWSGRSGFNPRSSHPKDSKKWYLMLSCSTLNIIGYVSRVKWSNPGKGVAPSPTPRCSSYRKGSLRVAFD